MAYKSVFTTTKEKKKTPGYQSIFGNNLSISPKDQRAQQAKDLINSMMQSGQADTSTPIMVEPEIKQGVLANYPSALKETVVGTGKFIKDLFKKKSKNVLQAPLTETGEEMVKYQAQKAIEEGLDTKNINKYIYNTPGEILGMSSQQQILEKAIANEKKGMPIKEAVAKAQSGWQKEQMANMVTIGGLEKSIEAKAIEKGKQLISKAEPLLAEARKHKSAEEFVKNNYKNQFINGDNVIGQTLDGKIISGKFQANEGKTITETWVETTEGKKYNIYSEPDFFAMAYDKVPQSKTAIKILNEDKYQLTDIWNKANKAVGEVKPLAQEAGKITPNIPEQTINLERLNISQQAKQTIQKTIDQIKPELETLKGGVLKNEQVIEAAKASEILTRATTKEATLKSEAILLKTRQQLAELAKQEKITPEFVETLKVVKAEATRRGRELQALGIQADPILGNIKSKIVKQLLDIGKKTDEIIEASKGVDFNNAKQVTDFYRQFVKPTIPELIDEYRYINLLSSLKTHIVNTFSNLLQVAGLRPATRLASGMIDNIAVKLTGKEQEYYIKQVPAYYKGVYNSIGDATKGFVDALRGKSLIYRPDLSRVPTGSKLLRPFQYIPRLLEGSDVFFRTLATGGEMESLLKSGISESKAIQKAADTASELVFRKALDPKNKTGQGVLLSGIDKLTSAIYKLRSVPGVKWFVPFVQTPMNILKQGIEYSPLGVSTLVGNANKIEQLGKAMVGSTVFAGAGWLALQDRTTWAAPTSEKEKNAFYDAGMQPYSIKIGDKWLSYSRLGPIAYPIATAAAVKYYLKDNPKSATDTNLEKTAKVFSGIAQFFSDQSYLEGIGDFINVAQGDITALSQIISNVPSQLIPLASLQRWTANLIDPIYRKSATGISVESVIQNLEKGIPFLSKQVPAYETPTGEPSTRQFPLLNQLSPIGVTKEKSESKELFNLMQETSKETKILGKEKEAQTTLMEAEYNRLKTIPKEQAAKEFDELIKNNPEMAKKIISLIKEEKRDLTPKDELLLSLGVENGLRAKTIKSELDKFSTKEEMADYYDYLINKKIITKQVNEQLLKLLEE